MKTRNEITLAETSRILLAVLLLAGAPVHLHAQLVTDGGTLNLTTATNIVGTLIVGRIGGNTTMNIISPGAVTDEDGYIGYYATSGTNIVTVTNTNAFWTNNAGLYVGTFGSGNQLIVRNQGTVVNGTALFVARYPASSNNLVVVQDPGSLLTNAETLYHGYSGSFNTLIISNGATVSDDVGRIGYTGTSSNNLAIVTGGNSLWTNRSALHIGQTGPDNTLVVTDDGAVATHQLFLGLFASSFNNLLTLDSGSVRVLGITDLRHGDVVMNGGTFSTGTLLVTNVSSAFTLNGGTLSVNNSTVDNGAPLVVGDGSSSATYQLTGNGLHTFNNGLTLANNAQLIGNGTVASPLTVQPGGSVAPGASVGKLVLSNSPTFQGSVVMEIGKDGGTLTNDLIQVAGPLTYGGTLTVSDLGLDALAGGDRFPLFSATSYGGAFTSLSLPALNGGLRWTNRLLIDGSIAVVATPGGGAQFGSVTLSGGNLILSGTGGAANGSFVVLGSTNVAAPLMNWLPVSTNPFDANGNFLFTNPIDPARPQEFYRLVEP